MHYFTWKLGLVSNILWLIVDDMKKTWRKKLLHGRYTLRTVNGDADRTTTHQWLSRSSLKGETQCFELAAHDQSLATRIYQAKIRIGLNQDPNYVHIMKKLSDMISGCSTIVNTKYIQRDDEIAKFYTGHYVNIMRCHTLRKGASMHQNQ